MKRISRPEEILHRAVVAHLQARGNHEVVFFHCPNGGGRSRAEAGVLKAMGVRPGVCDLLFIMPRARLFGLELKAAGKKPTDTQRAFGLDIERCGFSWDWADNLGDALEILEAYGILRPNRATKRNAGE